MQTVHFALSSQAFKNQSHNRRGHTIADFSDELVKWGEKGWDGQILGKFT